MSLNKAVENLKFDKRLLDLNLRLGRITQDEHDTHQNQLSDLEAESVKIDIDNKSSDDN